MQALLARSIPGTNVSGCLHSTIWISRAVMSVPSAGDSKGHVQELQTKHWSSALSTGPQSNVANGRWPSTATGVLAYQRAMHFSPTNIQHHQGGRSMPFAAAGIHVSAQSGTPQYGGYLRTGHAASAFDSDAENPMRVLVTGACGQVGSELIPFLRERLGIDNVIASDVKTSRGMLESGPFVYCDVQDKDNLTRVILESGVNYVVHLATLLSAVGERNPQLALRINTAGIQNILDLAATHNLQVYSPSTIAVFGESSPRVMTPNETIMEPRTMYGITKVHSELLGAYYRDRFNVDFRSLRYPGIISLAPPGGGTTDYAVEIFHAALKEPYTYNCFLSPEATLPMMYMPDCLEATWALMQAPREKLSRATYNVTAMSFSPEQLAAAIQKHVPQFRIIYTPDFRDAIANTWPDSIDDSLARKDWGWAPRYDLDAMAGEMLHKLQLKQQKAAAAAAAMANAKGSRSAGSNGSTQQTHTHIHVAHRTSTATLLGPQRQALQQQGHGQEQVPALQTQTQTQTPPTLSIEATVIEEDTSVTSSTGPWAPAQGTAPAAAFVAAGGIL